MLIVNDYKLKQEEYIVKFGINDGMTVVRGVSYAKVMKMPIEKLKSLFQPSISRTFRQFALETAVNGNISKDAGDIILDLSNICELAQSISCKQHKDPFIMRRHEKEIRERMVFRMERSKPFFETMMGMFLNNEIQVSICHPIQFATYFNTTKDDSLVTIVKVLEKKYDLIKNIHLVSLPMGEGDVVSHFVNTVFPSVVRSINPTLNRGRQLRGLREVVMHIRDIDSDANFTYTEEEKSVVKTFLNRVLEHGKNNGQG